ncbi:unnamed protein product [Calypogeia fissa]
MPGVRLVAEPEEFHAYATGGLIRMLDAVLVAGLDKCGAVAAGVAVQVDPSRCRFRLQISLAEQDLAGGAREHVMSSGCLDVDLSGLCSVVGFYQVFSGGCSSVDL